MKEIINYPKHKFSYPKQKEEKIICEVCADEIKDANIYNLDDMIVCQDCYSHAVDMDYEKIKDKEIDKK